MNGGTWALHDEHVPPRIDGARIEWGDTLNDPEAGRKRMRLMKFDVVVANPPFSLDKWGADNAENDRFSRFFRGVPPKTKGDWAFITHMIERPTREGRVAVVVPHGVLFRGGQRGGSARLDRRKLARCGDRAAANLFPTTSIPVAVLLFDRRRERGGAWKTRRDVFFVDASREFQPARTRNTLSTSMSAKIVATHRGAKNVERYLAPSVRRIRRERFQPQHSPLCRYLRGGGRG